MDCPTAQSQRGRVRETASVASGDAAERISFGQSSFGGWKRCRGDRRLKADGTRRALKHDGGSRGGIKGASNSARGSVLSEGTPPPLRRLIHSTSCLCAASFHSFFIDIDPRPFAFVLRVCITVRFDSLSVERSTTLHFLRQTVATAACQPHLFLLRLRSTHLTFHFVRGLLVQPSLPLPRV